MNIIKTIKTCHLFHNNIFKKPIIAYNGFKYKKQQSLRWLEKKNTSSISGEDNQIDNVFWSYKEKQFNSNSNSNSNYSFIKNIENIITCPITYKIFKNPVIAEDGITYENNEIFGWLKINNKSPITREVISNNLIDNVCIKQLVDIFLSEYPEYLEKQFNYSFLNFKDECINYVKNKNFHKLLEYVEFDLSDYNFTHDLFKDCKDEKILKHVIDNTIDLECEDNEELRPIHFICRDSTPEIIKYIIDKGVDLECETYFKCRPIHYICEYSTPEMIKYIIDKGVDLECETYFKCRPIHYICQYSTPEMIKYIIDKGVNLECDDDDGYKPIHLICQSSTPEMIKYIIDKGVDLECEDNYGMRPIHYICKFSTPEIIKYIIDKCVDLECENYWKERPIHYICEYSTPEMIKYIIDKGIELECENHFKERPIHLICLNSTPEMIKYIIDKDVNLECENKYGRRPIHFICRYSTPEMIKYIIDKGIKIKFDDNLILEINIKNNEKLSDEEKDGIIEYVIFISLSGAYKKYLN
jgi:ankyrin repeat protein